MDLKFDPRIKTWHVIFGEAQNPVWWQKLLKPGFRHVSALGYDLKGECWLYFDPGWDGITLRAATTGEADTIIAMAMLDGKMLQFDVQDNIVIKPRLFMTCVSQVLHLIGCNKFIFTPYKLFCALRKLGAKDSFTP